MKRKIARLPVGLKFQDFHITADDWGLSEATNSGILKLAQAGIVRRVSMLSTFSHCRTKFEDLKKIPDLSFGLHFNLTDLEKRREPAAVLFSWMWGGRKFRKFVRAEFEKQIRSFLDLVGNSNEGFGPYHFDGHEHIHLLPGLVRELAPLLKEAGVKTIRIPLDWSLITRVQAPIIPLSLISRSCVENLGFEILPFAYPSRSVFKNSKRLAHYLNENRGREIIVHPAEIIDDDLRHYDHRFLTERVLQFEALKALSGHEDSV